MPRCIYTWVTSLMLVMLAVALAAEAGATPQPAGAGQQKQRRGTMERAREVAEAVVFSDRDQQIIRNYYSQGRGLPPGLAKKGELPPGLAKRLRRTGSLPPGLQKRYGAEPFPVSLEQQLPKLPVGFSRIMVAGRAVLLDRNYGVRDIIALAE